MIIGDPFRWSKAKALGHVLRLGVRVYRRFDGLAPDPCIIHHTVLDRALQSPLQRMFQQRSELFLDNQAQGDDREESNLVYLLEWFVSIGWCAHDIQKSLRWASSGLISAEHLIDMHIVVESLTHSFALVSSHVHQGIMRTVVRDDETDVTAFWQIFGVDVDVLPSIALVNPWFFQQPTPRLR